MCHRNITLSPCTVRGHGFNRARFVSEISSSLKLSEAATGDACLVLLSSLRGTLSTLASARSRMKTIRLVVARKRSLVKLSDFALTKGGSSFHT